MSNESLIEKLEKAKLAYAAGYGADESFNNGVQTAIEILRHHTAAQGDVVVRVANVLERFFGRSDILPDAVQAAIVVLGDSARSAEVTSEVGVAHPTSDQASEIPDIWHEHVDEREVEQGAMRIWEAVGLYMQKVYRRDNEQYSYHPHAIQGVCRAAIRCYLRSKPKPVMVSLEKCADAYSGFILSRPDEDYKDTDVVKIILDSAGVFYVN